jgi:hypothetical protein
MNDKIKNAKKILINSMKAKNTNKQNKDDDEEFDVYEKLYGDKGDDKDRADIIEEDETLENEANCNYVDDEIILLSPKEATNLPATVIEPTPAVISERARIKLNEKEPAFFEKQVRLFCGKHAINNCFQREVFNFEQMKTMAEEFRIKSNDMYEQPLYDNDNGNFHIEFIKYALKQQSDIKQINKDVMRYLIADEKPLSLIIGDVGHYYCVKRFQNGGNLWVLDSMNDKPIINKDGLNSINIINSTVLQILSNERYEETEYMDIDENYFENEELNKKKEKKPEKIDTTTADFEIDNRWVVQYNPYLLLKFNCHINVEICSSIKCVKYLYKYLFKGADHANIVISEKNNELGYDEIKWRIGNYFQVNLK